MLTSRRSAGRALASSPGVPSMFDFLLDACPWGTALCWLALVADGLTPLTLPDALGRLLAVGAVAGTIVLALTRLMAPAADYLVGKAMGRKEALAEIESPRVVRMADRPMRMVSGGGGRLGA